MSNYAKCPECNAKLILPNGLELWDRLFCATCGVELEITTLDPLGLDVVVDLDDNDFEDIASDDTEALGWDLDSENDVARI
jgi:lysine biosynthesis protein LysW